MPFVHMDLSNEIQNSFFKINLVSQKTMSLLYGKCRWNISWKNPGVLIIKREEDELNNLWILIKILFFFVETLLACPQSLGRPCTEEPCIWSLPAVLAPPQEWRPPTAPPETTQPLGYRSRSTSTSSRNAPPPCHHWRYNYPKHKLPC